MASSIALPRLMRIGAGASRLLPEILHIHFGNIDGGYLVRSIPEILHRHFAPAAAVVEDRFAPEIRGMAVHGGIKPLFGGIDPEMGKFVFQPDAFGEDIALGVGFVLTGHAFDKIGFHFHGVKWWVGLKMMWGLFSSEPHAGRTRVWI